MAGRPSSVSPVVATQVGTLPMDALPTMIREWAAANASAAGFEGRAVESFRVVITE